MHFDCLATAVPVNFTLCRWVALVQCTKTALLRERGREEGRLRSCIYSMHFNCIAARVTDPNEAVIQLHLSDALQLPCYKNLHFGTMQHGSCIYPMHFNFVDTPDKIFLAISDLVASARCTSTTLLPRAGQGKDQMLVLHLCDALQLRCYSGIFLRNGKSSVASIRCTATTLLPRISWTVFVSVMLHLSDALQLRCYKQPHTVASQAESCICSMHFNYVATIVLSWIIFWPTSCIYAMHFNCHSAFLAPQNHYSAKKAKTLWQGGRKCPPCPDLLCLHQRSFVPLSSLSSDCVSSSSSSNSGVWASSSDSFPFPSASFANFGSQAKRDRFTAAL